MIRTKPKAAPGRKSDTNKGTEFVCDLNPDAKDVFLAGDFNNWDPGSHRMTKRKGAFRKTLRLPPGEYQYKFVVDGEWRCDPSANQVPNDFGTMNSVLRLRSHKLGRQK